METINARKQEPTMTAQYKSDGTTASPAGASSIARAITATVQASRADILARIRALPVGGVTTFPVKNVADAGGKTSIFVKRIG
jgi:hypothetical protein